MYEYIELRHAYIIISSCQNDTAVLGFCIPRHCKLQRSHITVDVMLGKVSTYYYILNDGIYA